MTAQPQRAHVIAPKHGLFDLIKALALGPYNEQQLGRTNATIMEGLAHFPMSEHTERFLTYLRSVLDDIRNGQR